MRWRVIFDHARDAKNNMAIDEAVMQLHGEGKAPPTLRFYTWDPPALSLGYFQKNREINLDACRKQGIDVVRRITGGRAVLHDKELTYSVIIRENLSILPPTLLGSYRTISQGLIAGLKKLGVAADMALPGAAFGQSIKLPKNGACFDAPSFYEIGVGKKKLIGSAQVRKDGVLLQHGSILLEFDAESLVNLLIFPQEEEAERCLKLLQAKATSLKEVLGAVPDSDELARIIARQFGKALHMELVEENLTEEELSLAANLARDKFGSYEWNFLR